MNISKLQGHIPDSVFAELQSCIDTFEINTEERMANFLGQCFHESAAFTRTVENLNYSGEALWQLFPHHFESASEADSYGRQPEKIANRIYANRMGNGDEASGDGWLHRGRGYIQLTGKTNQQAFFEAVGLDPASDPALIATTYPLQSAAWFWKGRGLNERADNGTDTLTIDGITKVINGGEIGEADRIIQVQKYYNILTT